MRISAVAGPYLAFALPSQAMRSWLVLASAWRTLTLQKGTYHPEAHYMRGPGPKCREKYAQIRDVKPSNWCGSSSTASS